MKTRYVELFVLMGYVCKYILVPVFFTVALLGYWFQIEFIVIATPVVIYIVWSIPFIMDHT